MIDRYDRQMFKETACLQLLLLFISSIVCCWLVPTRISKEQVLFFFGTNHIPQSDLLSSLLLPVPPNASRYKLLPLQAAVLSAVMQLSRCLALLSMLSCSGSVYPLAAPNVFWIFNISLHWVTQTMQTLVSPCCRVVSTSSAVNLCWLSPLEMQPWLLSVWQTPLVTTWRNVNLASCARQCSRLVIAATILTTVKTITL